MGEHEEQGGDGKDSRIYGAAYCPSVSTLPDRPSSPAPADCQILDAGSSPMRQSPRRQLDQPDGLPRCRQLKLPAAQC